MRIDLFLDETRVATIPVSFGALNFRTELMDLVSEAVQTAIEDGQIAERDRTFVAAEVFQ